MPSSSRSARHHKKSKGHHGHHKSSKHHHHSSSVGSYADDILGLGDTAIEGSQKTASGLIHGTSRGIGSAASGTFGGIETIGRGLTDSISEIGSGISDTFSTVGDTLTESLSKVKKIISPKRLFHAVTPSSLSMSSSTHSGTNNSTKWLAKIGHITGILTFCMVTILFIWTCMIVSKLLETRESLKSLNEKLSLHRNRLLQRFPALPEVIAYGDSKDGKPADPETANAAALWHQFTEQKWKHVQNEKRRLLNEDYVPLQSEVTALFLLLFSGDEDNLYLEASTAPPMMM